jgi:uncharacterized membrane protein YfcA
MELDWKELGIMFFTLWIGTLLGSWVVDWFGFTSEGIFGSIVVAFIPFLVFYLIWKNYTEKMA